MFARDVAGAEHVKVSKDCGVTKIKFSEYIFNLDWGKDAATLGKIFAVRAFEEMHGLDYDFVGSANLSRVRDHSTWFYAKSKHPGNIKRRIMCISPDGVDKLIVAQGDDQIISEAKAAINDSWTHGLQKEDSINTKYGTVHEFKLKGDPWSRTGEDLPMCQQLLLSIIGHMAQLHWKLVASTNLNGGIDAMFFVYDENFIYSSKDFAMVGLSRRDRLRLVNFDDAIRPIVRQSIMAKYQQKPPSEQVRQQTYEFKLNGSPFCCNGEDTIVSRRLICELLADLSKSGWDCFNTMIVSQKLHAKSAFVMQHSQPLLESKFACIALMESNQISIIDFPGHVTEDLRKSVVDSYIPGIDKVKQTDPNCVKMSMKGHPWGNASQNSLHARYCLMNLIEVATTHGWHLKASADVSANYVRRKHAPGYPLDVESLFFCYNGQM